MIRYKEKVSFDSPWLPVVVEGTVVLSVAKGTICLQVWRPTMGTKAVQLSQEELKLGIKSPGLTIIASVQDGFPPNLVEVFGHSKLRQRLKPDVVAPSHPEGLVPAGMPPYGKITHTLHETGHQPGKYGVGSIGWDPGWGPSGPSGPEVTKLASGSVMLPQKSWYQKSIANGTAEITFGNETVQVTMTGVDIGGLWEAVLKHKLVLEVTPEGEHKLWVT